MNDNIVLAEKIYNALKANGAEIGNASVGIIETVLEAGRLPELPVTNRKRLMEDVLTVRQAVIAAIPTGVSFAAIIIALAQLIAVFQRQANGLD